MFDFEKMGSMKTEKSTHSIIREEGREGRRAVGGLFYWRTYQGWRVRYEAIAMMWIENH